MPSIKTTALAGLCALAAFSAVSTAQAGPLPAFGDTVSVTKDTPATRDTATISFAGLPSGQPLSVYPAPELLSGTFATTGVLNLLAYCTDLYNYSGSATYTVGNLTSSHQSNGTSDLSSTQLNNIGTLINNANKNPNVDQAATQLAIWSVEYGAAFSFTNASGSPAADEANYIGVLNGSAPQGVILYQLQ